MEIPNRGNRMPRPFEQRSLSVSIVFTQHFRPNLRFSLLHLQQTRGHSRNGRLPGEMLNAMADAWRRCNAEAPPSLSRHKQTEILSTRQLRYNIKTYDKNMYNQLQNIPVCRRVPSSRREKATTAGDAPPSEWRTTAV